MPNGCLQCFKINGAETTQNAVTRSLVKQSSKTEIVQQLHYYSHCHPTLFKFWNISTPPPPKKKDLLSNHRGCASRGTETNFTHSSSQSIKKKSQKSKGRSVEISNLTRYNLLLGDRRRKRQHWALLQLRCSLCRSEDGASKRLPNIWNQCGITLLLACIELLLLERYCSKSVLLKKWELF